MNTAPVPIPRPPAPAWADLLLDEIECGLIVCAADGTICFANQAALRELASGRVLLRQGERLHRAPGVEGGLEAAMLLAARRSRRQLVPLGSGADQLLVSVLPLPVAAGGERSVLVMLGRRQPCSELGLEMLAAVHGLTLAERRVMAALVHKLTPREIAAQHAVALSTVRTQISSIRSKLGSRSIEDVLLRAAQVPPVASALRVVSDATAAAA